MGDANEGTIQNNYLYNDKELFGDGGLSWYDYGYRNYDPQIGRFLQVDPLSDDFPLLSPYLYAYNDPITNIDVDGLFGDPFETAQVLTAVVVTPMRLTAVSASMVSLARLTISVTSITISSFEMATNILNTAILTNDVGGPGPKPAPKVIGTTMPKLQTVSASDVDANISNINATDLSNKYIHALLAVEELSLSMYDMDNKPSQMKLPKGHGGNATIGYGHLIHEDAIGADQYDAAAVKKEEPFKNGITITEAFDLLSKDLTSRIHTLRGYISYNKLTDVPQSVKDVFFDYIYNAGNAIQAVRVYKKFGVVGLYYQIKSGKIPSVSDERMKLRLRILKSDRIIEEFRRGVDDLKVSKASGDLAVIDIIFTTERFGEQREILIVISIDHT